MEFIKWVLGYLYFQRRLIIGALLLLALGYWILHSKELVSRFAKEEKIEPAPAKSETPSKKQPASVSKSSPSPTIEKSKRSKEIKNRPSGPTVSSQRVSTVTPATAQELTAKILEIGDSWKNESPSTAFVTLVQKRDYAEQLLQKKLEGNRLKFAKIAYIESLSILDSLNVANDFQNLGEAFEGFELVRPEMLAKIQPFVEDPNPEVRSLAGLSLTVYLANDYVRLASMAISPTDDDDQNGTANSKQDGDPAGDSHAREKRRLLQELQSKLEVHADSIIIHSPNAIRFAEILIQLCQMGDFEPELIMIAKFYLEKLEKFDSDSPKLVAARKDLAEQIYFGPLNLQSLASQVKARESTSGDRVDRLLAGLEELPESSIATYQIALDALREYVSLGERKRALAIMEQLEEKVLPKIDDSARRESIQNAIDEFRPFLSP